MVLFLKLQSQRSLFCFLCRHLWSLVVTAGMSLDLTSRRSKQCRQHAATDMHFSVLQMQADFQLHLIYVGRENLKRPRIQLTTKSSTRTFDLCVYQFSSDSLL